MVKMNSLACTKRSRERIKNDIKRKLAKHSNFACSICGEIPIIFHHIEEWSKEHSDDEKLLIPICDKCHKGIHGEGGNLFSKNELYDFKKNPTQPLILKDKLPLERKKTYSFFIGSNFMENAAKTSLIRFPGGQHLLSIDTTGGILKLSILASINKAGEEIYLIKDNELMIDSKDIWDMKYTRNSLKIWKIIDGKKNIFIDLAIKPDVIILKRMETFFNGKLFRVYKHKKPQQRQINKLKAIIKECEALYHKGEAEINTYPQIYPKDVNGMDINESIKQLRKDHIKREFEHYLRHEYCKEFKWSWPYYNWVLDQVLSDSPVFKRKKDKSKGTHVAIKKLDKKIASIKRKYKDDFKQLKDIVVEYNGMIFMGCISI